MTRPSSRLVIRTLAASAPLALAACAPPVEVGFDSPDPQGRTIALARASRDGEAPAHELIQLLSSSDSAERMLAIRGLERQTGQTLGYRHYDPEPERLAAQKRWAEWWTAQGGVARTTGGAP